MTSPSGKPTAQSRPSLSVATYAFVLISLLLVTCVAGALLWSRSDRLIDGALDSAVRLRTAAAGQIVARDLHGDLSDLRTLADKISDADDDTVRNMIEGLRGDASRISWVGYAATDGTVQASSDGLLEGMDVSARPWFRSALQQRQGFAGDVHEAVLLASKLRPEGGDPLRFVDLAVPVRSADDEVLGVLGMHIDAEWVRSMLEETGQMLNIDLFLIDRAGNVIMAPEGVDPEAEDIRILGAARAGSDSALREEWSDGRTYFSSLVPSVTYEDLPSFGWRLAGRIGADSFRPSVSSLMETALIAGAVAIALLLVLTALFVRLVMSPISSLSAAADRIADGNDEFPPDNQSTREASELSSALGRLQGRRL